MSPELRAWLYRAINTAVEHAGGDRLGTDTIDAHVLARVGPPPLDGGDKVPREVARRAMRGAMKAVVYAVLHSSLASHRQLQDFDLDAMLDQAAKTGEVEAWTAYEKWLENYNLSGTGW